MIQSNEIKAYLEQFSSENDFSGVVHISQGDQVLISYTSGLAHRGFEVPNTPNTKFDTASITKTFTAVAIFQLAEQGLIKLDDYLTDYLDLGETSLSKEIKLHHLLTHSSGIGDDADEEAGESYEDLWIDKPNYSVRELKDFLPQFIHRERNFEPGDDCRYNNCAYILLGLVIEKVSGMNYRDYIQTHIFDKADMKNSGFFSMDHVVPNVAEGYAGIYDDDDELLGYKKNIYSYPPVGGTDGGAFATAPDLDRFMKALTQGHILSKAWVEKLVSPQMDIDENEVRSFHYAHGFEVTKRIRDNQVLCIHKDGSNPGVACDLKYYPESNTTVAVLSNSDNCDVWRMAFEISKHLGIELE